jgi:hypothetical protein
MTVTYAYLVGAWEDFDDTIRNLIYKNWTPINCTLPSFPAGFTPKMRSPGGENGDTPAQNLPNKTSSIPSNLNEDAIYFNIGPKGQTPPGNWRQSSGFGALQKMTAVYIDVYAQTRMKADLMTNEVNRIILQNQPNTASRVLKTDGSNSAIAVFLEDMCQFKDADPPLKTPQQISVHYSGYLNCLYQVTLS